MLSTIIRQRQRALTEKWVRHPTATVLVPRENMAFYAAVGSYEPGQNPMSSKADRLGSRRDHNVQVVDAGGTVDQGTSLWVRPKFSDYRKAYFQFIENKYDIKANPAEKLLFDVDHLFAKSRAASDSQFIRVEAVLSEVNQAWGPTWEAAKGQDRPGAKTRHMEYMICAKLNDQLPPHGPDDGKAIDKLVAFFRSIGIDKNEVKEGIGNMLAAVYGQDTSTNNV